MEYRQALAAGTVLAGEYRIAETLRQDGFSITYDAEDLQLKRHVLVKEFFPAEIADRVRLATVRPKSTRQVGVLSWGRQRFIEEAQTLTKFSHPGIARLKRVIEENNTAYAVIDAEDWPTLLAWADRLRRPPTQAELDHVARQLVDTLEVLHAAGVLVRDLSPESVYIRDKRQLVLVDFGAAKAQFAARARKMHAVVRPGYSAPEQYLFDDAQQGPWTDVFSLGAVLYRLFSGRSPADVVHRHNADDMPRAAAGAPKGYRLGFLQAIDRAMALAPAERPQSIAAMRTLLFDASKTAASRTAEPAAAPDLQMPAGSRSSAAPRQTPTGAHEPRDEAGAAGTASSSPPEISPAVAPPAAARTEGASGPAGVPADGPPATEARRMRVPPSVIPQALLSDKAVEEDRLGFTALDDLPEPGPAPDEPRRPEPRGLSPPPSPATEASLRTDAARGAEVEAMAQSNRRFMIAVVGIVVGLMAIIGIGLVTLERTLRPQPSPPVVAEQRTERPEPRRAEPAGEARRQQDEARRLLAEAERTSDRRRQEDEARRLTEQKRLAAEAEQKRLAEEAERRRREEDERRLAEQKRLAEVAAAQRQAALAETRRQEEAARKRQAEAAEKARQDEAARLAEQQRLAAEADRQRQAEAAEARRRQEEARLAEQRRLAEAAEKARLDEASRIAEQKRRAEAAERQRELEAAEARRQDEQRRAAEAKRLAELQRQEAERQLAARIDGEGNREALIALLAEMPAQRGAIERRLAALGLLRIVTGEGDVWRKPGSGEIFRDCSTCPPMLLVPAGQFLMGSPAGEVGRQEDEDDAPGPGGRQVRVTIPRPLAIGRFEVTRGQFAAFVTETGHDMSGGCYVRVDAFELFPDLSWQSPGYPQTDEHPVACVSWLDAQAYVAWLGRKTGRGYRLLSEAEWEFAARGAPQPVVQPRFPFGNADRDLCAFGNGADLAAQRVYPRWQVARCNDAYDHTAPVGSFEPNASGAQDMLGNLWEWIADCYHDSYRGQPAAARSTGAAWIEGCSRDLRVLRGGSWSDQPDSLRPAARIAIPADKRIQIGGFRVARTLEP